MCDNNSIYHRLLSTNFLSDDSLEGGRGWGWMGHTPSFLSLHTYKEWVAKARVTSLFH